MTKFFKKIFTLRPLWSWSLLLLLSSVTVTQAALPQIINYQSRLRTISGQPVTTATSLKFSLYTTASGGASLWTEIYDQPNGACKIITPDSDGYLSVALGSCLAFPSSLKFLDSLFLGVTIGSDAEATPRVKLGSAPYSFAGKRTGSFVDNESNGLVGEPLGTATAGTPGSDSSEIIFQGSGWDGDNAQNRLFHIKNVVTNASQYGLSFLNTTGNPVLFLSNNGDAQFNGNLTVTTDNTFDLGSSAKRLRKGYFVDLQVGATVKIGKDNIVFGDDPSSIFFNKNLKVTDGDPNNPGATIVNFKNTGFDIVSGKLTIEAQLASDIIPDISKQYNLGSANFRFNTFFGDKLDLSSGNFKINGVAYVWPSAGPTVDDQLLSAKTTGQLSWVNPPAGGGGGGGTVTSVGLTSPSQFTITGSPVTTNGVLNFDWNNQAANKIIAGPTSGADATPSFRLLVLADIPDLDALKITTGVFDLAQIPTLDVAHIPNLDAAKITTGIFNIARIPDLDAVKITSGFFGVIRGGTGLTTYTKGDLIYSDANNSLSQLNIDTNGKFLTIVNGLPSWGDLPPSGGTGTVTSVGLALPNIFVISSSPVVTNGTLTGTFVNQNANLIFAGPASGVAATPSFRTLTVTDIPNLDASKITSGIFGIARGGTGLTSYTKGDLIYSDAANSLAKLVLGTAGQILTVDVTGVPVWKTSLAGGGNISGNGTVNRLAKFTGVTDIGDSLFAETGGNINLTSGNFQTNSVTRLTNLGVLQNVTYQGNIIGPSFGGTGADLTLTGGANQFVKQITVGGNFTVDTITDSDIPDNITLTDITQITNRSIIDTTGTLTPARGGTGLTSYAKGDLIYSDAANSLSQLNIGTNGKFLTIVSGLPSWGDLPSSGNGTVTSVGLTVPPIFTVNGSPVTTAGTLGLSLATQNANKTFIGPSSGSDAAPTFRLLVSADIPALDASKITTGTFATAQIPNLDTSKITTGVLPIVRGGTGLTSYTKGDLIFSDANNSLSNLIIGNTNEVLTVINGVPTWKAITAGGGNGTVTSVGLALPNIFVISGSPVVTNGTLTGTLANQNANLIFAGPGSGIAASPTFRSLVALDIPALDVSKITTGVLPIARGGTNISTYTTGDLIYSNTNNSLAKLPISVAGRVLSIAGGIPSWVTPASIGVGVTSLSSITNAVGGNTINNGNTNHSWNWNNAFVGGNDFTMNFDNMGSGPGFSVRSNSNSSGSTGNLFQVQSNTADNMPNGIVRFNFLARGRLGSGFQIDDSTSDGNVFRLNANSLSSGVGFNIQSLSPTLTGDLGRFEVVGNDTGVTGNALKVGVLGYSAKGNALNITNAGTGLTMRINDDGTYTDTTPFVVDADGKTGIGIVAPATRLHVFQNDLATPLLRLETPSLASTADVFDIKNGANTIFRVQADGNVFADGTFNSGGADVAENYPVLDQTIAAGDIVSLGNQTGSFTKPDGTVRTLAVVEKSTLATQNKIIGIISTNPGVVFDNTKDTNARLVALSGRVPLKVTNKGGAIAVGDPLTASSDAGVAVKATGNGRIVGYALELYNLAAVGKINAFLSAENSGGGVAGSGVAGQLTFWNGANTLTGDNGLFWDANWKKLGIGTQNPQGKLDIALNSTDPAVVLGLYSDIMNTANLLVQRRARGTEASKAIVQNGDLLGSLLGQGWDGGLQYVDGAAINLEVDGTPGVSDMPGRIVFKTTPDNSGNLVERMRIDSKGNVTVAGNVGPSADNLYDLGSPTRRFRSMYVGPGTLHVGDADPVTGKIINGWEFSASGAKHYTKGKEDAGTLGNIGGGVVTAGAPSPLVVEKKSEFVKLDSGMTQLESTGAIVSANSSVATLGTKQNPFSIVAKDVSAESLIVTQLSADEINAKNLHAETLNGWNLPEQSESANKETQVLTKNNNQLTWVPAKYQDLKDLQTKITQLETKQDASLIDVVKTLAEKVDALSKKIDTLQIEKTTTEATPSCVEQVIPLPVALRALNTSQAPLTVDSENKIVRGGLKSGGLSDVLEVLFDPTLAFNNGNTNQMIEVKIVAQELNDTATIFNNVYLVDKDGRQIGKNAADSTVVLESQPRASIFTSEMFDITPAQLKKAVAVRFVWENRGGNLNSGKLQVTGVAVKIVGQVGECGGASNIVAPIAPNKSATIAVPSAPIVPITPITPVTIKALAASVLDIILNLFNRL